jgi:PAS domain S-box-containing protein
MPPDAARRLDDASREALATGVAGQVEHRDVGPEGTRRFIDRLVPEFDADGHVVSLLGISADITRRKRSEDDLLRFQAMSDSSSEVCFCADAETGRLTQVNRRAGAVLGFTDEELMRQGLADLHENFDLEKFRELGRDLSAKKLVVPYETNFLRKDGTRLPVEVTWNWLEFDGRPHLCGVARDLRERQQVEQKLRVSRERLDMVVQSTGLGLWYCDLPFSQLDWSDRCKELFGLSPDVVVTIDTFYERLHPDDRQRTREAIEHSIQAGAPFDLDYRTVSPEGRVRWIHAIGRCFFSPTGVPERFDGITVEATERKRVEEQLQEADRRKNEFLALLSHELRNPLAAIRNALYLLDPRGTEDPSLREAWEMLDRQSSVLASLVDDLLDVFRITHQKVSLHREHLDLVHLARLAVGDLQSALEHQGLTIGGEFPASPVWVVADKTRLTQVLMNVLNNAAKYTRPGGQVRVAVTADREARRALLLVKDTGVGIAPEMLPHVFDAFCQGELGLARTQGGLGLGLALVKGLVELHGGTVSVASAGVGLGSTFTVALPLSSAPHGQNAAARPRPPVALPPPPGRKLRILIIEDNRDTARSLRTLLQRYGHEVEMAHDGVAGVERSLAWKPDVVLCDLGLPELDGYQVAQALRADPRTVGTRLIAVSGYGLEDDRRRTTEAGFDLHLIKPVDPSELQRLLSVLKVGV